MLYRVKVRQPSIDNPPCECGCYGAVVVLMTQDEAILGLCRNCLEMVRAALKDGWKQYEAARLDNRTE